MLSAAELSVLIVIGGWGKPFSWSVLWRGTSVFLLWNSPQTSASAADTTTCFMILHSVWIGPLSSEGRLGDFYGLVGSDIG